MFLDYSPQPVYEGENTVMAQQALSYIEQTVSAIKKGKPAQGIFSYINNIDSLCALKSQAFTVQQFSEINHLDNCLAVRAAMQIKDLFEKMSSSQASKVEKANDLFAQEIVNLVKSHMMYLSFVIFRNTIETTQFKDKNILPLLLILAKIFALKQLSNDATACYESGYFGSGSKTLIVNSMKKLLGDLRP